MRSAGPIHYLRARAIEALIHGIVGEVGYYFESEERIEFIMDAANETLELEDELLEEIDDE